METVYGLDGVSVLIYLHTDWTLWLDLWPFVLYTIGCGRSSLAVGGKRSGAGDGFLMPQMAFGWPSEGDMALR